MHLWLQHFSKSKSKKKSNRKYLPANSWCAKDTQFLFSASDDSSQDASGFSDDIKQAEYVSSSLFRVEKNQAEEAGRESPARRLPLSDSYI